MKHGLWLPNIKRFLSGTVVGSSPSLNVNVLNTVPVPVAPSNYSYKERRFQDANVTQINAKSGAWVQIGDTNEASASVANTITEMRVSSNLGAALVFGKGANSGAVTPIGASGAGQSLSLGVALVAGDKIWVKALQDAAVTSGELLVLLLG